MPTNSSSFRCMHHIPARLPLASISTYSIFAPCGTYTSDRIAVPCSVTFELLFSSSSSDAVRTLWSWQACFGSSINSASCLWCPQSVPSSTVHVECSNSNSGLHLWPRLVAAILHPDSPTSCDDLVSMDCTCQVLLKAVVFLKTYLESCISSFFENSFRTFGTRSTWFQLQERVPLLVPALSINFGVVNHLARFICHLYCASSLPRSDYFALSSCAANCVRQNATLMSFGVGLCCVTRSHSCRTRLLRCWSWYTRECCPCEHVKSDSMTTSIAWCQLRTNGPLSPSCISSSRTSSMRDKREHTGRRPRTPFAFWSLLFHCFIVFRDRRSVRLQQLLVCSLPAHSSLTPSLPCQHFLLVLWSTLRQDFVLLTPSGASPLRQKPPYVKNVHPSDPLNFNRESMATSWLAASRSCYSSNSLLRIGLYADVTLNSCSSLLM